MTHTRQILVLYAHPNPSKSRVQKVLHRAISDLEGVEIRDLYQMYPHFYIDAAAEQEALRRADLIIFQHPIYWYSAPALLKEWQDTVLVQGFAYGPGGVALRGKDFLQVISWGSVDNRFPLPELLRPFEATAFLCGLHYHHPFTVQGITALKDAEIDMLAQKYRQILIDYRERGRVVLEEGYPHE